MVAVVWAVLLIFMFGTPAAAHAVVEGLGSFQAGLLHPLLTPAHALALVALGLRVSQQKRSHRQALLILFAASLLAAVGAIAAALAFTEATNLLLGAALVAGLLTALARPLPFWATGFLIVAVAIGIAFDSVPQEIWAQPTLLSLAGTILSGWLILVSIAYGAAEPRREWMRIGVRILGSWTAASALLVLALRLTR
jgi:hydrogenase/urease accessory protein HupE